MTQIPIELKEGGVVPSKGSKYAAAFDLYCPKDFELHQQRNIVPLAFCMELPMGWDADIRPRSGFSVKGLEVEVRTKYRRFNGEEYDASRITHIDADVLLGLIDCDYRSEVGVMLKINNMEALNVYADQLHQFDYIVENHVIITKGTRLAQMKVNGGDCEFVVVKEINRDIDRGGGYGHTGAK